MQIFFLLDLKSVLLVRNWTCTRKFHNIVTRVVVMGYGNLVDDKVSLLFHLNAAFLLSLSLIYILFQPHLL